MDRIARVLPSNKSGILVSNRLKCRTFENHVLLIPPPVLIYTGCTNVYDVGEDPPYGVPRHWVARGSPSGSAKAV